MKVRLLVMNGQRIVQEASDGDWGSPQVLKIDKARDLKPGIYNIYTATDADKTKRHDGVIVHSDIGKVYQQVGKVFVIHARLDFDKVPSVGSFKSIDYNTEGKAVVNELTTKLTKERSR